MELKHAHCEAPVAIPNLEVQCRPVEAEKYSCPISISLKKNLVGLSILVSYGHRVRGFVVLWERAG